MRLVSTTLVAAAVVVAFVAGRSTGMYPTQIASAQGVPEAFSHFKCYQTSVKLDRPVVVALADQFSQDKMQLSFADLFCTPVKKTLIDAKPIPLPGPADHLLCYHGESHPVNQTRTIVNQLQKTRMTATIARYLCVPTWKEHRGIPTNKV